MWKKIILGLVISAVVLTVATGAIYGYIKSPDNALREYEKTDHPAYSYADRNCYRYENSDGEGEKNQNRYCFEENATSSCEYRIMHCYEYRNEFKYAVNSEVCKEEECINEYKNRKCNEALKENKNCPCSDTVNSNQGGKNK